MTVASPSFRKIVVVLGLAAILTLVAASARSAADPVAHAAKPAKKHNISRPYVKNWVFRSTKLKRCVFIEVSGSMVGTWQYLYGDHSTNTNRDLLNWTAMRLRNPSIEATGWPIRGAGCDSTKRWPMKANLTQGWYQSTCKLSVSVGVGFPWSVSASPTYKCGSGRVGHRGSTEGPARKTLSQFNTGYPIRYAHTVASVRAGGVGFTGVVTVRAHTKRASDAVRHVIHLTLNK